MADRTGTARRPSHGKAQAAAYQVADFHSWKKARPCSVVRAGLVAEQPDMSRYFVNIIIDEQATVQNGQCAHKSHRAASSADPAQPILVHRCRVFRAAQVCEGCVGGLRRRHRALSEPANRARIPRPRFATRSRSRSRPPIIIFSPVPTDSSLVGAIMPPPLPASRLPLVHVNVLCGSVNRTVWGSRAPGDRHPPLCFASIGFVRSSSRKDETPASWICHRQIMPSPPPRSVGAQSQ